MRTKCQGIRILVACGILYAFAVPALADTHPHDRTGFMVGFGLGGASAGIKDGDKREASGTANFRIGYAIEPDLVIAFEGSAWTKTFTESGQDFTWTFSTDTVAITYFPSNVGVFLRGGIGVGTAKVELKQGNVTVSESKTGLGLLAAGGYEWRLTKKFALGPQVEFSYQHESSDLTSNIIGGGLNLNWYW